jgi:hypothetical protein
MLPTQTIGYHRFENDLFEERKAEVIVEKPVSLTVNGKVWLTFMCTPVQLSILTHRELSNFRQYLFPRMRNFKPGVFIYNHEIEQYYQNY